MSIQEVPTLTIGDVVVHRNIPMNDEGMTLLRNVRQYLIRKYQKKHGITVEMPYPSAIHIMLEDYTRLLREQGVDI